jgi:uncharacterized protein YdaU (DUF1376 family)
MYYHQFNFTDFFYATRFLKNHEVAIYLKLQIHYLHEEEPLKDNISFLSRLCDASDEETLRILNLFYELKDGSWHKDQLDKIIADYKSNLDANSRGGKKSAEIRKEKALAINSTSSAVEVTNNHELVNNKPRIDKPGNRYRATKPSDVDVSTWERFLSLRQDKKAGNFTHNLLNSLTKEAEHFGIDLNTALNTCVEREWVFLKREYLEYEDPKPWEY